MEMMFIKVAFLLALAHIDPLRMPFWILWVTMTGAIRIFVGLAKYRFKVLGERKRRGQENEQKRGTVPLWTSSFPLSYREREKRRARNYCRNKKRNSKNK